LAGAEAALKLISSGNPVSAEKAHALNLIDRIVEDNLFDAAFAYAQELIKHQAPTKRIRDISIEKNTVSPDLFNNARKNFAKRSPGQIALQHIVGCIEGAVDLPFDQGLKLERKLFMECLQSDASAAMRHLFFAERMAAKVEGIAKDQSLRAVHSVGIIGGGTMGGGIAMNFANAGIPVTLIEVDEEAVNRGLGIIDKNYGVSVKKGKLSEQQKKHCLSLIRGTTQYQDLTQVDLVIEAVFENLELKKEIFARLDKVCKPGAILGTNTSYQDIDLIAEATQRSEDVIGMHFFSPANIMKLLEVVRGKKSADDVIATSMNLAKTIKKIPVLAGNCYGFIGNRMLKHYFREAHLCLIEGATPEQIDGVMEKFGMAMGPLAVGDLAGLDVGYKARQALTDEQKGATKTYCIVDALVEMGRLGQKSGAGYYLYDPDTRARIIDPEVMKVVEQQSREQGIDRTAMNDEQILNRLIMALINEGANILEQGIAQRSSDIDVVYAFGYGFPRFRGGPMHYADSLGLQAVFETISALHQKFHEPYWQPAPLLAKLVSEGKNFAQWKS
jgi:3-hydroxyacyl-CoA dehydrogenase